MTAANVQAAICLICKNATNVSSCTNIFYTSLPKNGELLATLVIGTIHPNAPNFQRENVNERSYLCSDCYNLFKMLEEAQSTVTSIKDEILKIYNKSEEEIVNREDIYRVIDEFDELSNEAELISTNNEKLPENTENTEVQNDAEVHNDAEAVGNDVETPKNAINDSPAVNGDFSNLFCSICSKKCKTSTELKSHMKSHSSLRPYMCEKCGQAYKHKHALKIHIGMHNGINPFKCSYCDKCFTQKGALMRHLPMHTGETPYQCELCGKRFVHHTSYNMHVLSHTGKKSHQCHICSLSLLSKSHLKRHLKVHSGEKPFGCDLCGKKFAERYNLIAHQKIHDPEDILSINSRRIEYKCNYCAEIFVDKETFEEHVKKHSAANDISDKHQSQTNWEGLHVNKHLLSPSKYKEFDLIIRNDYQEHYNAETI